MIKNAIKVLAFLFLLSLITPYLVQAVGLIDNTPWGWNLSRIGNGAIALGDLNNDNWTDIILTGVDVSTVYAKVYINNGTSLNTNITWQWNLSKVYDSSLALGDIDNDGDLDLGLIGWDGTTRIAKIYTNNGTSFSDSIQWGWNLTAGKDSTILLRDIDNDGRIDLIVGNPKFRIYLNNGTSFNDNIDWAKNVQDELSIGTGDGRTESIDLGDYDNDGDLDIMVAGHDNGDPRNKLFKNNGTSFVLDVAVLNEGRNSCDASFGDLDNDGDLDLVELGAFFAAAQADVFVNNNSSLSYNSTWTTGLSDTKQGALAWGDYNNDGKLDLLWTGNYITKIYNNTGTGFAEDTIFDVNITGVTYSSTAWMDIDNDMDLDTILIGYLGSDAYLTKIYLSNSSLYKNNSLPYAPSTFDNHSLANGNVFLGWNNGSDNETIGLGLYYNLRVGTTSGGNDIVSGFFGNGGRGGDGGGQNGQFGNMMQRRNISLLGSRFSVGQTYYWSVQTIDTALAKSEWSVEKTFNLTSDFTPPTITLNAPADNLVTNVTNITFNALVYDDNNLTNVSLYGNWSEGWHSNTTNSSGINNTNYIFNVVIVEGTHLWGIRACDNTANCVGSNQTFRIDITSPIASLISPTNGSSWTTANTVNFTYNVLDLGISNCSLMINGLTNRTNTSILVIQIQNFTTNLPNGNYNWSVRCTDQANNINFTGNYTLTVSYTVPVDDPPSSPGGSSGGGGGSGGTASLNIVSRIIPLVIVGDNTITLTEIEKKNIGIEEVVINSNSPASNAKIIMEKLSHKPVDVESDPNGKIYSYLRFDKTILTDDNLESAVIKFTVNRSWVLDNNYQAEDVALSHYKTGWEKLPTKFLSSDSILYHYEAKTKGFSYFAINAENKAVLEENKTLEEEEIQEPQLPPEESLEKQVINEKKPRNFKFIGLVAAAFILLVLTLFLVLKRKPKKKK